MREIPLTRGMVALVDDDDYDDVSGVKWCAVPGSRGFYARRQVMNSHGKWVHVFMHQFIMGDHPDGLRVDHRDGDGLNNTRKNLRWASLPQNAQNRVVRKTNRTGYKGVTLTRLGKYRVRINVDCSRLDLGTFLSPEEAARAYDRAALEHFGEFARLNFPEMVYGKS